MTFRRTSSGLSNLHLFVGVQTVVFLEGGPISFTRERIEDGEYSANSADIRFWQTLFDHYRPNTIYQFRSIGSKEAVKSIALDIKIGNINNVIAIMDRDFDNLTDDIINGDNILYTCGYSWENDCWSKETINSAVILLAGLCATKINDVDVIVSELFDCFYKQVKRAVKVDSLLLQNGASFFDREKPARYISIEAPGKPRLCMDQIKQSFAESRGKVSGPIFKRYDLANNPSIDCFGHLVAHYSYRVLIYLVKTVYKLPTVAKDYATAVIVEKFIFSLSNGDLPNQKLHYDDCFNRVTA